MSICVCSSTKKNQPTIRCESELPGCPGNGHFHLKCIGLTMQDAKKMSGFVCSDCISELQDVVLSENRSVKRKNTPKRASKSVKPRYEDENSRPESAQTIISESAGAAVLSMQRNGQNQGSFRRGEIRVPSRSSRRVSFNRGPPLPTSNRLTRAAAAIDRPISKKGNNSEKSRRPASRSESVSEVFEILAVGDDEEGRRKNLVHWKGFDNKKDYTWEYESDLVSAYHKVKEFYDYAKLGQPTIEPRGGASPIGQHNEANWISLEILIHNIKQNMYGNSYASNIELVGIDGADPRGLDLTRSQIIAVLHYNHFYIVYYDARISIGYISDSLDICLESRKTLRELSDLLRVDLLPIQFKPRLHADHCGAAAVLIALELIRLSKTGKSMEDAVLDPPKQMRDRLVRKLHPFKSEASRGPTPVSNYSLPRCSKCCKWTHKERKRVLLHERTCKGKKGWIEKLTRLFSKL